MKTTTPSTLIIHYAVGYHYGAAHVRAGHGRHRAAASASCLIMNLDARVWAICIEQPKHQLNSFLFWR